MQLSTLRKTNNHGSKPLFLISCLPQQINLRLDLMSSSKAFANFADFA